MANIPFACGECQEILPEPEDKNDSNKEKKKDDNVVDADFEEVKDDNKEKSA